MSFEDFGSGGGARRQGGQGGGAAYAPRAGAPSQARAGQGYQTAGRDGDSEYVRLSQLATSNNFTINQNVAQLQKMALFIGTARDVPEMREKMNEIQEQTRKLVRDTNDAIKRLGQFDGGSVAESRERRMQQDKLGKDFKLVLQKFQACSQVTVSKERDSVVQARGRADSARGVLPSYHSEPQDDRQALIEEENRRQLAQFDSQIDYSSALIEEREQGIKDIESTMLEVNEIYRDLSTLVVEQGTQLDNIEANMTSVDSAVESGVGELGKASHYQKKARNKMCCILVIVVIALAILVAILATQLKKKK